MHLNLISPPLKKNDVYPRTPQKHLINSGVGVAHYKGGLQFTLVVFVFFFKSAYLSFDYAAPTNTITKAQYACMNA